MSDPIWQPEIVVSEVTDWLSCVLPVTMGGKPLTCHHGSPPPDALLPFVVISSLPGSVASATAAVSGCHDITALRLGIRAVASTETSTRALSDLIRAHFAARVRGAGFATLMTLGSVKVIDREAGFDGFPDLVAGLWQQHEAYTLTYQRR